MTETLLSTSNILLFGRELQDLQITKGPGEKGSHDPFVRPPGRAGGNRLLDQQLMADGARLARIYGFSFEGTYYDLPRPVVFLVHGKGAPAETLADPRGAGLNAGPPTDAAHRVARSPDEPSRTGLAAPDFSFADGLMVWSYDKADYTIRMDVETGMFEQVLLDMVLSEFGWGGPHVSGGKVSGGKVSGARPYGPRWRGDAND
jgi:hypothetical protein